MKSSWRQDDRTAPPAEGYGRVTYSKEASVMEFLDPRAEPSSPVEAYALSIDLTRRPVTIGLLANGFPDSVAFLRQVEAALATRLPHAAFHHIDKSDASSVVSDSMLDSIVSECRAVVAAYGH
jgi:hypothetical protein